MILLFFYLCLNKISKNADQSMIMKKIILILPLWLFLGSVSAAHSDQSSGKAIIRVEDHVRSHCIDASRDTVWLDMLQLVTNRNSDWFTEDKSIGMMVNTTITGTGYDDSNKAHNTYTVSYPKMKGVHFEQYHSGHGIQIPIQFGILEGFKLKAGNKIISSIGLDIILVRKEKSRNWANGLGALIDVTKKLIVPFDLFSEGFELFAEYATQVAIGEAGLQKDDLISMNDSTIHITLSPDGDCGTDKYFFSTGTIAVVTSETPAEHSGIIDADRPNQYCYISSLAPSFEVKFARKNPDGSCPAQGTFETLMNDHYAFYLNAISADQKGAGTRRSRPDAKKASSPDFMNTLQNLLGIPRLESVSRRVRENLAKQKYYYNGQTSYEAAIKRGKSDDPANDIVESLLRCRVHGISEDDCFWTNKGN